MNSNIYAITKSADVLINEFRILNDCEKNIFEIITNDYCSFEKNLNSLKTKTEEEYKKNHTLCLQLFSTHYL